MKIEQIIDRLNEIREFIGKFALPDDLTKVDWQKVEWGETLGGLVEFLKILPESFKMTKEDIKNNYYTVKCECGWWGSSRLLSGGIPLADTGDYDDVYCPVCGNTNIEDFYDF